MVTAYERLEAALPGGIDRNGMAHCPGPGHANGDVRPSLSVTRADGKALVNCLAGCATADVLEAIGWSVADLFDQPGAAPGGPGGEAIAAYAYTDEAGVPLFYVERRAEQFRQYRETPAGRVWNLAGIRRVPYRLPRLLEAAASGGTVYVAEGEKDVHALEAAGAVATCNPGGAGKWRAEYAGYFKGAGRVIVVADRDGPGRRHAAKVAASLRSVVADVEVLEAADGKDAADHLAAGHDLGELRPADPDGLPPVPPDQPDGDRADPLPDEPKTELGYARRLIKVYGDRLRYVPAWRRWLLWDGTRWAHDSTGQAARWMKATARRITADALAIEDKDARAAALSAARRGESSHAIAGALTLASTEEELAVGPDQLDADPFLLNCANGTLDLRTLERHDHDPADLLTKVTRAAWRPDAPGGQWAAFLAAVQPDTDMRGYLARLGGLALEGRVTEHLLAIFYGAGANGKTTYCEAVTWALGDYAGPADPDLLTARTYAAHPTGTADLFGVRLALLYETDRGRELAEATVKRLTGGDRIKARRMREDFWSFTPSHTFVMLTNHRPVIRGTDDGIWRRVRLIPWEVQIAAEEQDAELGDRLRLEADAVLAFLAAGYADWRGHGLGDPDQVVKATDAWRGESDALGRFLEQCVRVPGVSARSGQLFTAWREWCEAEHEDPGTQTAFSLELERRGYRKHKTGGIILWGGIAIPSKEEEEGGSGGSTASPPAHAGRQPVDPPYPPQSADAWPPGTLGAEVNEAEPGPDDDDGRWPF